MRADCRPALFRRWAMAKAMSKESLAPASQPFLDWLERWLENLSPLALRGVIAEAGGSENVAVYSVDVINGFCHSGPLASERVGRIVEPIERLFTKSYEAGVRRFILIQDAHPPDSPEFAAWGPHCIAGTEEAQMVTELASLPFVSTFRVIPKRSVNSHIGTDLAKDPLPRAAIVVGDVTDICAYQLAMGLRAQANAQGADCQVIVPENCVQTYDLPVDVAGEGESGPLPHPGDLMHAIFLYHLRLNGVRIVSEIA